MQLTDEGKELVASFTGAVAGWLVVQLFVQWNSADAAALAGDFVRQQHLLAWAVVLMLALLLIGGTAVYHVYELRGNPRRSTRAVLVGVCGAGVHSVFATFDPSFLNVAALSAGSSTVYSTAAAVCGAVSPVAAFIYRRQPERRHRQASRAG